MPPPGPHQYPPKFRTKKGGASGKASGKTTQRQNETYLSDIFILIKMEQFLLIQERPPF